MSYSSLEKSKNLNTFLSRLPDVIDPITQKLLSSFVNKKFHKLITYQISSGGKRIRPALAILSCKLLGGRIKDVLYPATGLEILHNATLIIDDVIDNSFLRRNKPTLWYKFGRSIALCVAFDYLASVFQAAIYSKNPPQIAQLYIQALKEVVNGEILDILFEQGGRENEEFIVKNRYKKIENRDYFEMVSQKTAVLFQTSCQIGAICAKAKEDQVKFLKKYGYYLGLAFQIRDDILDIFGEMRKFGKAIGKDIEERKGGNIVVILALEDLGRKDREKLLQILRKKKKTKKEIRRAVEIIKKTEAHLNAEKLGEKYIKKAKGVLKKLPQNKWNNLLEEIADFIIKREK